MSVSHDAFCQTFYRHRMAERLCGVGHWSLSIATGTTTLSEQARALVGTDTEGAGHLALLHCFDVPSRHRLIDALRAASATVKPVQCTVTLLGDTPRVLDLQAEWRVEPDGTVAGLYGIVRDVSETALLSARLAESDRRHADFVEVSSDWLWEMGLDLCFTYMSPQVEAITGVPVAYHIGKSRRALLAGKTITPEMEENLRLCESHQPFRDFRYWRQGPNGRQYLSTSGKPVFAEDGTFQGYRGSGRDLTQIRLAEERLLDAQKRQEDFISVATDWLWELGPDHRYTYVSAQIEEIVGISPKVFLGKTRRDLLGESPSPGMLAHLDACERHEPFRDFRFWVEKRDGTRRFVSTSGKPVYDQSGTFLGYRGSGRDLTAAHATEEALREANDKLQEAIADKTQALDRLSVANTQLEQRNRQLLAAQSELEHAALHDALTGIPNRRFLDQRLVELTATDRENEQCQRIGVLHIDIDGFKQINDTFGHAAGDAVLRHVASWLSDNVPRGDFVARVGGDEFVVISPDHGGEMVLGALASRIIDELSKPYLFHGRECWFGASIGVATTEIGMIEPAELLVNADIALYRAKRRGRGCFEFFSAEVQREMIETKRTADAILAGVKRNEFKAWFQPQVDARTYQVVGVEALARWDCPGVGWRPPRDFLSIAGDLNVVGAIDRMVLEHATDAVAQWIADGVPVYRFSVNVSASRLMDERLIESLRTMNLPRGLVTFELLESVFLDDVDEIIRWNIDLLKEMGIRIELDDFGSGHASIIGLIKLGPDAIKIDKELIGGVAVEAGRFDLVRSIVEIGHSLNVSVIAEGVETRQDAVALRRAGVDVLQGFFISEALLPEALPAFIEDWHARWRVPQVPSRISPGYPA